MRKSRKRWKWVILAIPIFIILIGLGIVFYFGIGTSKEAALLGYTAVTDYKPELPDKEFNQPWSKLPEPGSKIGDLKFPSVGLDVQVVQGTDDNELKQGAGHFAGSSLPGQGGNVVLSGHNDTVFKDLENLKKGDEITFTTPYGDFVYKATKFKIVNADDQTIIVPKDYETLTLTTCYPFSYIGDAPERYIIYTKLITSPKIALK
ncbi:class D sortase [Rummeliibacillus sp. JY-2-4R]